jgi:hypothetical protein
VDSFYKQSLFQNREIEFPRATEGLTNLDQKRVIFSSIFDLLKNLNDKEKNEKIENTIKRSKSNIIRTKSDRELNNAFSFYFEQVQ